MQTLSMSLSQDESYRMDLLYFWEAGEECDRDKLWLLVATGRMVPSTTSGPMQHARKGVQDLLGLPAQNPHHSLAASCEITGHATAHFKAVHNPLSTQDKTLSNK